MLELQCDPEKLTVIREVDVVADLSGYAGAPITTCQFWVVSTGSGRIRTVERGFDLQEQDGWGFRYSLRPAKGVRAGTFADTVLVVVWGPRGLANGSRRKVAILTVEVPAGATGNVRLSNVMAAVATGDDAGLRPGRELVLKRSPK